MKVIGNSPLVALHKDATSAKDLFGRILLRIKIFLNTNVFKPQNKEELDEAKIQVKLLKAALASNSLAAVTIAESKTHSCKKESGIRVDGTLQTWLIIRDSDFSQTLELPTENLDLISARLHQLEEQLELVKFPESTDNLQYFNDSAPKKTKDNPNRQDKILIEATSESEKRFLLEAGYKSENIKLISTSKTNINSNSRVSVPEQPKVKTVVNNKELIKAIIEAEKQCLVAAGYNSEDVNLILDTKAVVDDNILAAKRQGNVADLETAIAGLEGAYTPHAIAGRACTSVSPEKLKQIQDNVGKRILEEALQQFNDEVEDAVSVGWQNILGTDNELSIRYDALIVAPLYDIDLPLEIQLKSASLADIGNYEREIGKNLEAQLLVLRNDTLPRLIKEIVLAVRLKRFEQ